MLHFGFLFNDDSLNRLAPLGICPRQRTGLHQVIYTPSCLRRLSLNTFYKIRCPRKFFERMQDPSFFSLSKVESSRSA